MSKGGGINARANLDVNDVNCLYTLFVVYYGAVGGTYNNIRGYDVYYPFYAYSTYSLSVENVELVREAYTMYGYNVYASNYLINVESTKWNTRFLGTWTSNGKFVRQYEFDLNVTDNTGTPIQNANVTVAGQTSPGGITLTSSTNDVLICYGGNFNNGIFRFLRFRAPATPPPIHR